MIIHHSPNEKWIKASRGALLVRPEYGPSASRHWFHPDHWGENATPVDSGGRGTAWFIQQDHGWVLRWYTRGGLIAKLNRSSYLFTGVNAVRSVAEFRLLNTLYEQGLPVPRPIGAYYERTGRLAYRAAILTCRLSGARSFARYLGEDNPHLWREVGRVIRRFHALGVDHADLNCDNILVAEAGVFLIDFDRGRIRSQGRGWQERNLSRLKRSIDKLSEERMVDLNARLWLALREGYNAAG